MPASIRKRTGRIYQAHQAGRDRYQLDEAALLHDGFVTWEPQRVELPSGRVVSNRFVLWVYDDVPAAKPAGAYESLERAVAAPPPPPPPEPEPEPEPAGRAWPPQRRYTPRGPRTTRHKGITRIDRPAGAQPDGRRITASYGYMVRVRWKNRMHQKWFSDRKHGDRLGALGAALDWRDAIERRLGKPRTNRTVVGAARSNTGKLGVYRRTIAGKPRFEVAWVDGEGRQRRTSVSIDKYGERRALRRAVRCREMGEIGRLRAPRAR